MTKYIVKNCPCFWSKLFNWQQKGDNECLCTISPEDVNSEMKKCEDLSDCPIKQVVKMCKKEIDNSHCCKDRQTLQKQEISCGDCIHLGRRGLSKQILQTLQVEEVE